MKTQDNSTDPQHIYRQLKLGLGHELVNDANVFALIALAHNDGNQLLATELREWQAPCSDSDDGVFHRSATGCSQGLPGRTTVRQAVALGARLSASRCPC